MRILSALFCTTAKHNEAQQAYDMRATNVLTLPTPPEGRRALLQNVCLIVQFLSEGMVSDGDFHVIHVHPGGDTTRIVGDLVTHADELVSTVRIDVPGVYLGGIHWFEIAAGADSVRLPVTVHYR